MKKYRSVFLLLIAALFLSGRIEQTANRDSNSNSSNNLLSGSIISADTSIYDVRFSFKGYQTFNGDTTNCPIRPAGTVVLKGLLKGIEDISGTDDVFYEGTLQLDIDIDICSVKGEGDNAKPCSITITGSGLVKTELQVYYDKRGGYIQIRDTTSRGFRKNAGGTCHPDEIAEEQTMIPLRTIATVFNGMELPMLTHRTLRSGPSQSIQTAEGELKVEILRKVR